jgi:chromate transporter
MIALLGLYRLYGDQSWVRGMGQGVIPVVMVMMVQLTLDFFNKSRISLGWMMTLIIGLVAGGLIYGLGLHPGLIIGALLIAALLRPEKLRPEKLPWKDKMASESESEAKAKEHAQ